MISALALSGCTATNEIQEQSFEFEGSRLDVVNSNANMPVTATEVEGADGIVVTVQTQTLAKSASTPAWALNGSSLDLGTPCEGSMIGYCEGSYSIAVPAGTAVFVDGVPTSTK